MNFFIKVAIVCLFFLLLFFLFLTILFFFSRAEENTLFPAQVNQCPDFWESDSSGNCFFPKTKSFTDETKLINTGSLSCLEVSSTAPFSKDGLSFNVSDERWMSGGKSAVCSQREWAIKHKIVWDGVSNYNQCI
jgi:hypothetical protein